jgi:hypothetical protein
MARLMGGIVLLVCFVLSLVGAAAFRRPLSSAPISLLAVALLVVGIALIVSGRRRITLLKKVGVAVVVAARKTGRVNVADIAGQTRTNPDEIREVAAMLVKRGIIPPDVEVS